MPLQSLQSQERNKRWAEFHSHRFEAKRTAAKLDAGERVSEAEEAAAHEHIASAKAIKQSLGSFQPGDLSEEAWGKRTAPRISAPVQPGTGMPPLGGWDGEYGSGNDNGGGDPTGTAAERLFGRQTATSGFGSLGEFLQTLGSGRFDSRMQAANTIGIDSQGGFLVPEIYQNAFLDATIEDSILTKRVRRFPMSSDTLSLNGFSGSDHTSDLYGGLEGAWEPELPGLSEQTAQTRRVSFNARKLMILSRSSNELLTDAPAFETMLGEALVKAMSFKLDYALFQGDGSGKPLGIIHANSTIEVAKQGSQTAATFWYDNAIKMFARLHPNSYKNAIWAFNPTLIPQLFSLDVHESASALGSTLVGDFTYRPFRESDGKFSLFGLPAFPTEKLPVLGTMGDIVLVDPSQYGLAMRREIVVEKSGHAGFQTDSTYYRAKLRCDGQPLWADPMTPRAGDTLSWCVTLATRE